MAFSAGLSFEVQNGGSDTANSGAFRGGSALSTPSAPAVSNSGAGGTVAANTYYLVVTETDGNGETGLSSETSTTTSGATSSITVTSPSNPNVQGSRWNIYVGTISGGPYWAQSTGLSFGTNRSITSTPPTSGVQPPGTDWSQGTSPHLTGTNLTVDGTTNTYVVPDGHTPDKNDVGNTVVIKSGAGFTLGVYEIIGFTSGNWMLDRSPAATTTSGGAWALGGCFATPGMVLSLTGGGPGDNEGNVFIKYNATAYTCSSTANVAGGRISDATGIGLCWVGYNTTRTVDNTDTLQPTLKAGADSMTILTIGGGNAAFINNIAVHGNTHASVTGINNSAAAFARNCTATNCNIGFSLNYDGCHVEDCFATGCATSYITNNRSYIVRCTSVNATSFAYSLQQLDSAAIECYAYNTAGPAFNIGQPSCHLKNCGSHTMTAASTAAFKVNQQAVLMENCWSYNVTQSSSFAFQHDTNARRTNRYVNCAADSSGGGQFYTGFVMSAAQIQNFKTLSVDPVTNAASYDFSLNNTAGGGVVLRGAAWPTTYFGTTTNSYGDIGPAQILSTTASGPPGIIFAGAQIVIDG